MATKSFSNNSLKTKIFFLKGCNKTTYFKVKKNKRQAET